jgi:hypothetical protein
MEIVMEIAVEIAAEMAMEMAMEIAAEIVAEIVAECGCMPLRRARGSRQRPLGAHGSAPQVLTAAPVRPRFAAGDDVVH